MEHDYRKESRYAVRLLGDIILTTALYALAGWLLFNAVFAFAMYFRPVRKSSATSVSVTSAPGSQERGRRPTLLSRILLFGFWLNDGRHSA